MSPARALRDFRQQLSTVGPPSLLTKLAAAPRRDSRRRCGEKRGQPFRSNGWFAILAVAGAMTIFVMALLAQSTPAFAEQRGGISQSMSGTTETTARPNRSSQQTKGRFSDDRPITPSGRHAGSDKVGKSGTSSDGPSAWRTFGTLAAIVGLIVIGARLWKKHGPRLSGGLPAEAIEVLGKRNIDTRQSIVLVRLGSRILVLGSTANELRSLTEITDPVEVDYLAGLCRDRNADNGVAQSFRSLFSRQSVADSSRDSADESAAIPFSRPEADEPDADSHRHAVSGGAHA